MEHPDILFLQYSSDDNLVFFHHSANSKTKEPYYCRPSIHDDQFEIHFLLQGNATYNIEGREYKLPPQSIICVPKGHLHSVRADMSQEVYERFVLQFSEDILPHNVAIMNVLYTNLSDTDNSIFRIIEKPIVEKYNLKKLFYDIERYGLQKDKYFYPSLIANTINLLIDMNKILETESMSSTMPVVQHPTIQKILNFVHDNIEGDVSIKTLSQTLYLNEDYLSHLFRKHIGLSYKQYTDIKKMRRAAALIDSGYKPTDVAEQLGYMNYSTFYQRFTQIIQRKPSIKSQRYVSIDPTIKIPTIDEINESIKD